MSDTNNQKPPEFVVPNNGRMWSLVRDDTGTMLRECGPDAGMPVYEAIDAATSQCEIESRSDIGCGSTCHVVELHVQTAETRAEQMRRLAKAIADAEFDTSYEKAYIAGEIAEILGLDECWVSLATGVDPDECRDATDGPLTLGDVSDE